MKTINGIKITPEDEKRFWDKVDIKGVDDCWYWIAGTGHKNRGRFNIDREIFTASRVALAISGIIVEKETFVLHSRQCTYNAEEYFGDGVYSGLCCNPKHLRIGTSKENARDTVATGRARGLFDGSWYVYGETHPFAKLSTSDVENIRKDTRSQYEIAKEYNVDQGHVSNIKNFKKRKLG